RNSIGIVLVVGMATGTFFTLFVVPALYMLLASDHGRSSEADDAADHQSSDNTREFAGPRSFDSEPSLVPV
ncbi:MAG: hypothetical protein AAGA03_04930, partial [Planctomycetota bacterium]